jgi:hypothetical protein
MVLAPRRERHPPYTVMVHFAIKQLTNKLNVTPDRKGCTSDSILKLIWGTFSNLNPDDDFVRMHIRAAIHRLINSGVIYQNVPYRRYKLVNK